LQKNCFIFCLLLLSSIVFSGTALADEGSKNDYGIGIIISPPTFGVSFAKDFTEKLQGQAVLGAGTNIEAYSLRATYKLTEKPSYFTYVYGNAGTIKISAKDADMFNGMVKFVGWKPQSFFAVSAGAGIAYKFQTVSLEPFAEVGYCSKKFKFGEENFHGFIGGIGVQYRF
jgi:hypothetical protein